MTVQPEGLAQSEDEVGTQRSRQALLESAAQPSQGTPAVVHVRQDGPDPGAAKRWPGLLGEKGGIYSLLTGQPGADQVGQSGALGTGASGKAARRQRIPLLLGLSAAAVCCWLLGMTLPIVVIYPLPIGGDKGEPVFKSTVATVRLLWERRHFLALCILFVCSVLVPAAKAVVTTVAILSFGPVEFPEWAERWLNKSISVLAAFSSYQCVDLLLGILVVAFLRDEVFVSASIQMGFYFFALYCGISQALLLHLQSLAGASQAAANLAGVGAVASSPQPALADSESPPAAVAQPEAVAELLETNRLQVMVLGGLIVLLFALASMRPMLDVSIISFDFCVAHSQLGLLGVAFSLLDAGWAPCGLLLTLVFLLAVVLSPLMIVGIVLASGVQDGAALDPSAETGSQGTNQRYLRLAREVAHWSLSDVFALALVTFIFTMQDEDLVTTVPESSHWLLGFSSFHAALALGAAGFSLKWFAVRSSVDHPAEFVAARADRESNAVGDPGELQAVAAAPAPSSTWLGGWPSRFAAPWIAWILACIFVRSPPGHQRMASANEALRQVVEIGNKALETQLPASLGDCRQESGAPEPCRFTASGGVLAHVEDENYGLEVTVRWATGVNTIRIQEARALRTSDPEHPIELVLGGVLQNLSLSMLIEKCFMGQCDSLFDNTDGCCEPDRTVQVTVATSCHDGPNGAELEPFSLQEVKLDNVYLKETLFGVFRTSVADLSGVMSEHLETVLRDFLEGKRLVLDRFTIHEIVGNLWRYNVQHGGTCQGLLNSL